EARSVMQETASVEPPAKTQSLLDTTPLDISPPETLPPPVPEAELPVQAPGTSGAASGAGVYATQTSAQDASALPVEPPAIAGTGTVGAPAGAPGDVAAAGTAMVAPAEA